MKILHIIIGLNVGGAELMLKRLIESHHDHKDFHHTVISLTENGEVGKQLAANGIHVQALGMRSALCIPRVFYQVVRSIRRSRPHIVQTWMYHADLLGGLAARVAGERNIIWGVRTTEVEVGASRITPWVRQVCAWLSKCVPHTIVCAAEASRRVHIGVGYDPSRMVVVPNGFDLLRMSASEEERALLRKSCGLAEDDLVVGTLGRFNKAKHQENFVRAAGLVMRQYPKVRFLMVGRELDHENAELKKWILKTDRPENFVLLGERNDAPVCLAAMNVFCLPSRTEGFPNVVGEAMAMALPCVVTDVGDAAMLVADTGLVVPKEDHAALAQGIVRFISMRRNVRAQYGEKAKARVHAEFSMERARECYESIYRSVAGRGQY